VKYPKVVERDGTLSCSNCGRYIGDRGLVVYEGRNVPDDHLYIRLELERSGTIDGMPCHQPRRRADGRLKDARHPVMTAAALRRRAAYLLRETTRDLEDAERRKAYVAAGFDPDRIIAAGLDHYPEEGSVRMTHHDADAPCIVQCLCLKRQLIPALRNVAALLD
jgi:hypothetical protein